MTEKDLRERADDWLRHAVAYAASDARESAMTFYKTFVALAGGTTILSLTFLEKLMPSDRSPRGVLFLFSAWTAFAASLVVILIAFLLAAHQFRRIADTLGNIVADLVLDSNYTPELLIAKAKTHQPPLSTFVFDLGAVVAYGIGIVALVIFAVINYP